MADDFTPSDGEVYSTDYTVDVTNTETEAIDLDFGFTLSKTLSFDVGESIFDMNDTLNISSVNEALHLGDGTASDQTLIFDDGTDRTFGWDDSLGAFSLFGQALKYNVHEGASPPATCDATTSGTQWRDTDTGILYSCDTSNSRNKWLSINEYSLYGENALTCSSGEDLGTTTNTGACVVNSGDALGADTSTDLGIYIPQAITITGYGVSTENDDCPGGTGYDLEVWGTGSSSNDNAPALATNGATVASGLTGEVQAANNVNVNVPGNQYIIFGLDNNCGSSGIQRWNSIIYYRYHHS